MSDFKRAYERRSLCGTTRISVPNTTPGFRLSEIIDEYLEEGVVPDLVPAELGFDESDLLDRDGNFLVDPKGRLRDRMEVLEDQLMAGLPVDASSIPDSPVAPADPAVPNPLETSDPGFATPASPFVKPDPLSTSE